MKEEIGIGVLGAGGRMGRAVVNAVIEAGAPLAGGAVRRGNPLAGQDVGVVAGLEPLDLALVDDEAALFAGSDVVIDFTLPAATARHAALAARMGKAYVVGTTGLGAAEQAAIRSAAETVPVVQAANFSLGVNLLAAMVERAARVLGPDFDIEILEMHHRHKRDAPSGTSLALGRAAASGRGVILDEVADRARDGVTGERTPGHIGFAVMRGGDVAGDHTVVFAGPQERLELTHRASDRMIFARGAVAAALWTKGRMPGLYGMAEVLGLKD
jgi:4-hydroxy-tetrahydrodipicolinate reductase